MSDTVCRIGRSLVQHGKENNRIYLMQYHPDDSMHLLQQLTDLATQQQYTKIIAKVPQSDAPRFLERGYTAEARIPGYYADGETCVFVCRYLATERNHVTEKADLAAVLALAQRKAEQPGFSVCDNRSLPHELQMKQLGHADTTALAGLYRQVFKSYPFPIDDPAYLQQTMHAPVIYFGVFAANELVAAASSENDQDQLNCEMTDFAVQPPYRGKNLAGHLLAAMEQTMTHNGYRTFYTIARAVSVGMNATFARAGYTFGGTLINNTQIGGRIESMNVWYKAAKKETTPQAPG